VRPALAGVLLLAMSGCALRVPPPRAAAPPADAAGEAWARVLAQRVDEQGRIDFDGIARDPADLEAFIAWIAAGSPESAPDAFATRDAKLAYYLNAYNALALYDVLQAGLPPDLYPVRVRIFYRNRFRMGRRDISLYSLENSVIRPMGEPRVHVALNCMARGCPRLPREPFRAEILDAQLDREARRFYNEERNVRPEPERRMVRLSQILQFYTSDFLAKAPSLIDYVNLYRDERIPSGWKVEFIPYDWRLNRQ